MKDQGKIYGKVMQNGKVENESNMIGEKQQSEADMAEMKAEKKENTNN